MKAEEMDCDVLVVGLGPVGAVLAALLGQDGRNVVAIEPQRDVYAPEIAGMPVHQRRPADLAPDVEPSPAPGRR